MFDKSGGHIKFDRWHRGATLFVRTQRHQITENRVANSILTYFFLYLNLKKLPPPCLKLCACSADWSTYSKSFYPEYSPFIYIILPRMLTFIILPRILSLHHFTIILPRMLTSFSASCPQTTPRRSRSAGDLRLYTPALTSQSGWTEVAWGCPRAHASTLRRMTGFRRRRLVIFRLGELSRTPRWTSITV